MVDAELSLVELLQNNEINLYHDSDNFHKILNSKQDTFTIMSLNCQSLNSKFEILKTCIETYSRNNHKINAICLQETWLVVGSDLSLLQLPEYNLISVGKSYSAHMEEWPFTYIIIST